MDNRTEVQDPVTSGSSTPFLVSSSNHKESPSAMHAGGERAAGLSNGSCACCRSAAGWDGSTASWHLIGQNDRLSGAGRLEAEAGREVAAAEATPPYILSAQQARRQAAVPSTAGLLRSTERRSDKKKDGRLYYCNGSMQPLVPERAVGIQMAFWTVAQQHCAANTRGSIQAHMQQPCSSMGHRPRRRGREGVGPAQILLVYPRSGQIFQAVIGLAPHRCQARGGGRGGHGG